MYVFWDLFVYSLVGIFGVVERKFFVHLTVRLLCLNLRITVVVNNYHT